MGLVAIGASGGLAAGFGALFGKAYVAGDPPGVTYTAARCADFHALHPEAATYAAAAIAHHFDEIVAYRFAAGILGVLVLLGAVWLRRRLGRGNLRLLPEGFAATVGASLFGAAAAALLLDGLAATVAWGGGGGPLSGGLVALAVFAAYAAALLRLLEARASAG